MSTEAHTLHAGQDGDQEAVEVPAVGGDRLSAIRAKRQELQAKRTLTLLVPGYGGLLGVRYKVLPRDELGVWVQKLLEQEASISDNMDLLIRCCDAILVRQDENSKWEPFDLDTPEPTTFQSGNLASGLGETANSAREEVVALFSPGGSQPLAPEVHAEPLIEWQRDSDVRIDRALLGE